MRMSYSNWTQADDDRRNEDERLEGVMNDFLDNFFYPVWTSCTNRNTDKSTQIHGLDITVTSTTNNVYSIDEKAAVRWANKNLQTFAFEIDSISKNGNIYDGWAISSGINEYWLLAWVDSASTSMDSYKDIQQVTVSLISRSGFLNWLDGIGLSMDDLKSAASALRAYKSIDSSYRSDTVHGYKIIISNYSESATNILIPRDELCSSMCIFSAVVTPNHVVMQSKGGSKHWLLR